MDFLKAIDWFFLVVNDALDLVLPWLLVPALLAYPAYQFIKGYKKAKKEQKIEEKRNQYFDLLSGTLILILVFGVIYIIFWVIPWLIHTLIQPLSLLDGWKWIIYLVPILRWLIFSGLAILVVSLYGKKNGENRWKISTLGHVLVLFIGWVIDRWIGIFFISIPLIAAFYAHLYSLATVILPTAEPDNRKEKQKRFLILVSYLWGIQRPMIVSGNNAWEKTSIRIPGDTGSDFKIPGLIWLRSHEVVGLTGGSNFIRVDGPGTVFTQKKESPLQVMDLRIQTHTSEIDVVSKDGINFKATIFTSFRLDGEKWDPETYQKMRNLDPTYIGKDRPTYTEGSYSYSEVRIKAAIDVTSIKLGEETPIYWDRWALNVIEDISRRIIAQKKLDELWRSDSDQMGDNALEKITNEVFSEASLILRVQGILLIASRITDFRFPNEKDKPDKISEQQIMAWESEWIRKREGILAEAQAESDRIRQGARADAEANLLTALAEGLQKTGDINPNLPKFVIAARFLSALQSYVHQPPTGEGGEEYEKKVRELQNYLKYWQEQSFPSSGKEKQ